MWTPSTAGSQRSGSGLALMFVLTGPAHFDLGRRAGLVAMVPPRLPRPELLVTVTGVLELAGAARAPATPDLPATPLLLRTALQVLYLAAAVTITLA